MCHQPSVAAQAVSPEVLGIGQAPDHALWADDDRTACTPDPQANSPDVPSPSVVIIDDDAPAPAGAW